MPYQMFNHPLMKHKLTMIRDTDCSSKMFREVVTELSGLMVYEISRELKLVEKEVETPIATTIGYQLKDEIVLVPILRAGLGMVDGIQSLIPSVKIAHIGMFRDPDTLLPTVYYAKFPKEIDQAKVYILDPLLATGGSVLEAIRKLRSAGVKDITVLSLIGVMEGINKILHEEPTVKIYLIQIDDKLNDHAYIVPGLGDAGDRLFGTK
ncbi:MAG: uracil phosphoribosyltransferase [Acholeplasmataceae bacterium]|jgi:uracil phosphoribosyltransferase|nr:uracil phosphoribosyltransferase [Acholeplasmataceae bacterium]